MFAHLISVISSFVSGPVIASIAMILEFLLRMVPSQKPLGVLIAIQAGVHSLADLIGAIAAALDKVVPQKIAQ